MVVDSTGDTENDVSTQVNNKPPQTLEAKTNEIEAEGEVLGKESTLSQSESSGETQQYVKKSIDNFRLNSKLNRAKVPEISIADLKIGETLGKGGFGIVKEAKWRGKSYAMKSLLPSVVSDENVFRVAASDLLKEADFLSSFDHPNIIAIHAKRSSMTEDLQDNFLLIDRLHESLTDRMKQWRKQDSTLGKSVKLRRKLQLEGLSVALQICDALLYLHNQSVVFRDLKLSNVGFDEHGSVKIFDFGIAKELKELDKSSGGKYKLSGNTGSLAYMAPEVAKNWKYDKMVDVYSFGILLWEIAALKLAFATYSTPEQMADVWSGDERPPMEQWWHVEVQWLMKKCWSYFPKSRPDFDVVKETLEEILEDEEEEEQNLRGVKSFRFGSRRSQKISVDMTGANSQRSHPNVPRHFFGRSSRRSSQRDSENGSDRSNQPHTKVSFDISHKDSASHKPSRRKKQASHGTQGSQGDLSLGHHTDDDSNQEPPENYFLGNHSNKNSRQNSSREKQSPHEKKFFGLF